MVKTALIILHYKGEDDTKACLDSLRDSKIQNIDLSLIVVANNPSASLVSDVRTVYPELTLIENKENVGFAEGNNIGIRKALELQCEYIVLLNNDTLVSSDIISKLVTHANSQDSIGLISPKIYFAKGYEYHKERYKENERGKVIWYGGGQIDWQNVYASHYGVDEVDVGQYDKIRETDFTTGCCMLIKRNVVEKIGFFDKKYFLYFEDVDYSIRAKKNGFRVLYFPEACLWHKNASSSDKPGSSIHMYYQTRNRLYFGYKYAPFKTKKSLFFDSLRLYRKNGIMRKAVSDFYLGRMGRKI